MQAGIQIIAGFIVFFSLFTLLEKLFPALRDKAVFRKGYGLFPVYDLLFGTFYMPGDQQPQLFGIKGNTVPESLWAQMTYPFRKKTEGG